MTPLHRRGQCRLTEAARSPREQENARQKLRQPNKSKIERTVGDLINLPPNGHGLHFDGRYDQETRNLEQHERRMGERGASSSGVGRRRHLSLM